MSRPVTDEEHERLLRIERIAGRWLYSIATAPMVCPPGLLQEWARKAYDDCWPEMKWGPEAKTDETKPTQ